MGKPPRKKGMMERRKRPRSRKSPGVKPDSALRTLKKDSCANCAKSLKGSERALFVEEEIGRIFCSEECISEYFTPDVEVLEQEYLGLVSSEDLAPEKREELAYLRWITMEEPDEAWRQKTPSGDFRYTLISEFNPSDKPVWFICICLLLRGDPSFLFIAFPTVDERLVHYYRRGEKVQWIKPRKDGQKEDAAGDAGPPVPADNAPMTDGLADKWTEDETVRARLGTKRREDDIPQEEYQLYQGCMNETLDEPDEIWSVAVNDNPGAPRVYHFIKHYPEEAPPVWFVIVARDTDNEEQLEVVDAFPTKDPGLVQGYRQGEQEMGGSMLQPKSKLVH